LNYFFDRIEECRLCSTSDDARYYHQHELHTRI